MNKSPVYTVLACILFIASCDTPQKEIKLIDAAQRKVALISDIKSAIENHGWNADLNHIDTSAITDMSYLFAAKLETTNTIVSDGELAQFSGDISKWDVSRVYNMERMFHGATAFNGDISKWDVSSVILMSGMFANATAFNGDISTWNVSRVTYMSSMFYGATAFNSNISTWNVSSVTDMRSMFSSATAFNGDISTWNVSSVTDMNSMFRDATAFDKDLDCWASRIHDEIKGDPSLKEDMFKGSGRDDSEPLWYKNNKVTSLPSCTVNPSKTDS